LFLYRFETSLGVFLPFLPPSLLFSPVLIPHKDLDPVVGIAGCHYHTLAEA